MEDMKRQQQLKQHLLWEVVSLKKKVGRDPRHSDLILELNVLEAAMIQEMISHSLLITCSCSNFKMF